MFLYHWKVFESDAIAYNENGIVLNTFYNELKT